ncbi:983_t:CDS:2, partial [Ambispora leptoticha]
SNSESSDDDGFCGFSDDDEGYYYDLNTDIFSPIAFGRNANSSFKIAQSEIAEEERTTLRTLFTINPEKRAEAERILPTCEDNGEIVAYFKELLKPGRPAKKQKLGNPLFTNLLDVVLNLRKTLPESLRDDIETMSEEQEIEQEELTSNLIQHPDRKPLALPMRIAIPSSSYLARRVSALDDNLLYCFEDSNLFVGDFEEFSERLYNPKTWYLVDGTVPRDVLARTVVCASSKSIKDRGFQEFLKKFVNKFCMPPWSIEELEACRLGVYPELPQDLMLELSDEAGGVPRYVLDMPASIIRQENPNVKDQQTILSNRNEIKKMSLERVEQALSEISDFRKLIQCFSENSQYVEFSSRLVHRWPDTFYREQSLSWASGRIFDKIQKKLEDSRWNNLFLKIQDPDDPSSSRGIMFESHVLHLFKLGGQTFESRRLKENKNDKVIYTEITLAIKPTTDAVDLILTPDCIFQITVSPKHPVKQSELIKIVQNMPAYRKNQNAKIFLYFIVPDDIYDTFGYQSYLTPKKKIGNDLEAFQAVKRKSPILNNVEQWIVKIKMAPEMTITSVLNNAMAMANSCL